MNKSKILKNGGSKKRSYSITDTNLTANNESVELSATNDVHLKRNAATVTDELIIDAAQTKLSINDKVAVECPIYDATHSTSSAVKTALFEISKLVVVVGTIMIW